MLTAPEISGHYAINMDQQVQMVEGVNGALNLPIDYGKVQVVAGAIGELTSPPTTADSQSDTSDQINRSEKTKKDTCCQLVNSRPRLDLLFNAYDITDARKSKPVY